MSDMKTRFVRALNKLEETWETLSQDEKDSILSGDEQFCTRWLRNESGLWADYQEDESFIINGVQTDPNHPDNLSDMVLSWFLLNKGILND